MIGRVVFGFIDAGLILNRLAVKSGLDDTLIVGLPLGLPVRLAQLFKWVVLFPTYKAVGLFLGERSMGVIEEKITYYAGFADWYIEDLISKDSSEFNEESLFDLSYLNAELKNA